MLRRCLAGFLLLVAGCPALGGELTVLQYLVEPEMPESAWLLTRDRLQRVTTGGAERTQTSFDREIFEHLTSTSAGALFCLRKIQSSRSRAGGLYLLVEAGVSKASLRRYIFFTSDLGHRWRYALLGARHPAAESNAVDLSALDETPADPPSAPAGAKGHGHGGGYAPVPGGPSLKALFDLALIYRPGSNAPPTFNNYHHFLLIDYVPRPEIQFSFEVTSLLYYELDYHLSDALTLRAGKILIPFDVMDPHNSFGGRINTSLLSNDSSHLFLPDVWADLGVGLRSQLIDSPFLTLTLDAYVVNGFNASGADPASPQSAYPNFNSAGTLGDNNSDKAVGLRVHTEIDHLLGLGLSVYEQRYTNEADPDRRIGMAGFDAQLHLSPTTDLALGYAYMSVGLPPTSPDSSFSRGGIYANLVQRLSPRWRIRPAAGLVQSDSRIPTAADQSLVGADLIYDLGWFQISGQVYHDLDTVAGKNGYEFIAVRAVFCL